MDQELGSIWKSKLTFTQKLIRIPLRLIPRSAQIKVRSGFNKGFIWITGANIHKCWLGSYEPDRQKAIAATVRPGMVVWDIGANVGFYTLAFSRAVGDAGSVVAFEPLGSNVAYLVSHVRLNKLDNVTIIQAAVSEVAGLISFTIGAHSSMGRIVENTAYRIPAIAVDEYMNSQPQAAPDLIKIDVEGAEAFVLRGARRLLQQKSPEIWLALHGSRAMADCTDILLAAGYSIFRLDGTQASAIDTDEIVAIKKMPI
jgi:FkbM family methyltransferase